MKHCTKQDRWVVGVMKCTFLALACTGLMAGCSKGARASQQLEEANAAFQADEYDKAEIGYMNSLRLQPTNALAFRNIGLIANGQGRTSRAYAFLNEAKKQDPSDLTTRTTLGSILFGAGDVDLARAEAMYVVERQPTNEEALVLLVNASINATNLAETKAYLARQQPTVGRSAGFLIASGVLQARDNDLSGAESSMRQAVAANTNSAMAHYALGTILWRQKRTGDADAAFKTAADLAPPRSGRALAYAEFKLATGDVAAGRQILEKLVERVPDYNPGLTRLAEIIFSEGKPEEAQALVQKVLARDPANLVAILLGVRTRMAKNEVDKALVEMESAASAFPNSPLVQYELAKVQLAKGDQAKGTASLQKASSLSTNYLEPVLALAQLSLRRDEPAEAIAHLNRTARLWTSNAAVHLLLAEAYRAQGNLASAVSTYQRAVQLAPTNAAPLIMLGVALRQQTNNAAARKAFEQAVELDPNSGTAVQQLIAMDLADQRPQDALQRAAAAVARYPKSVAPHLLTAQIHATTKDFVKAEEALRKALELDPNSQEAQMMLANIAVLSGRKQQALERLEAVVAGGKTNLSALLGIASLHSASSNYAGARDAYERILAVQPNQPVILNNLADLYSEHLGDLNKALELARRARQLAPTNAAVADTLGWILYRQGNYSQAITLLSESSSTLTQEPQVLYHLGATHYMQGEEVPAKLALQSALNLSKNFPGSVDAADRLALLSIDPVKVDAVQRAELEKRLVNNPDDPVLLRRIAFSYQQEGAADKAAAAYERALRRNPNSVPMLVSLAQLNAGKLNQPVKAMDYAKKARNLAPENTEVALILGRLSLAAGDSSRALDLFDECARKTPGDPELLLDLASSQFNLGLVSNSLVTVQKAVELFRGGGRVAEAQRLQTYLGIAVRPETANASSAVIQDGLVKTPDYAPVLVAAAYLEEQKGNYPAARDRWMALLKSLPGFKPAYRQLAQLYFARLGDPRQAYEYATKARDAFREDPAIARTLGILSYQRQDYSRAEQLLSESAKARPDDGEGLYYLGMSYYQLKRPIQAKAELTKALAAGISQVQSNESRGVLDKLK